MVTLINLKLNCRLTPNLYFATIQPDILLLSQTFNNCSNLNQFYLIFRRPKSRRSFHPSNTTAVNSDIFLETRNIFHNKSRNLKNYDIFSNWESTLISRSIEENNGFHTWNFGECNGTNNANFPFTISLNFLEYIWKGTLSQHGNNFQIHQWSIITWLLKCINIVIVKSYLSFILSKLTLKTQL